MHPQDLTEESPTHDVGFHSNERVLHGEAALSTLAMRLAVVEAALVLV